MMAEVSVIVPTYDRAPTLEKAIESVLEQTLDDFELLVIDDGSTDNTESVVQSFADERIKYVYLNQNQGANAARNVGIRRAVGEYISFLDSDDTFHPEKLEVCVRELDAASKPCVGVFHSMEFREEGEGEVTDVSHVHNGEIGQAALFDGNPIGGFSDILFRANVFDTVGYLDENLPAYQDYEFFLRVLEEHTMKGVAQVLSTKTDDIPSESERRISDSLERKTKAQELLVEKHPNLLSQKVKSEFHYTRGFLHMDRKEPRAARREFRIAIRICPKNPLYHYHYLATIGGSATFRPSLWAKNKVKLLLSP